MHENVIVAFREGEPDRYCELTKDACIIGRSPDADLILPHSAISRHHATVRVTGDRISIEDHESKNGVFLNGEQVKQSVVKEGDFLAVEPYTVVLRTLGKSGKTGAPKGKTVCLGYDAVRELHEAYLEKHSPEYFRVLCKAALLLGGRLQLDRLLEQVLSLVVESIPASRGAIVIHADELGEPRLAATLSLEEEQDYLPLSKTLIEHVLRTRTALLTEDALVDPRFRSSGTVLRQGLGAAMCVPLFGTGRTVGAFYIDNYQQTSSFTEKELEFLTVIGRVVGMTVENKLLDEAMAKQERLAALGQAIGGISHDVANVLTGIKGGLELLERARDTMDPEQIEVASQIVQSSAHRVEAYLGGLLHFVRERKINRDPTYINGLILEAMDVVRPYAEEHAVGLVFKGGGFELANIDGPEIYRVLVNMLRNGIDACKNDGGTVTTSVSRKADALTIHVSDTGTGIRPKDIPRLPEPFFTTKGNEGTGLGLAISYRIVEQHGGKIIVDSTLGKGSVFSVIIPECVTAPHPVQAVEKATPVPNGTFKKCPACGHIWTSQHSFLMDPELTVVGYQA